MKRPTFMEGVLLALVVAGVASLGYTMLSRTLSVDVDLRLLLAATGWCYVLYLVMRSPIPGGHTLVLGGSFLASVTIWVLAPSLPVFLVLHTALIWVTRTLYFYRSLLPSITDAVLNGAALTAAGWAATQTGSPFLALWCFFLVQACFAFIPAQPGSKDTPQHIEPPSTERFTQAYSNAERALRRLSIRY